MVSFLKEMILKKSKNVNPLLQATTQNYQGGL